MGSVTIARIVSAVMLALGLACLLGSVFSASYVQAFVGLGLAFRGALLLLLMPTRHVRLELPTATAASSMSNTERLLTRAKTKLGSVPNLLTVIRIHLGKEYVNRAIALMMLVLGIVSLLGSVLYSSYVAAFIGLGLSFWGALLLYIFPSKHVRLDIFTAAASSSLADIQKVLVDSVSVSRGVYLPPKLLKDYRSSLVFVPSSTSTLLPKREEVDEENLRSTSPAGIYLTPPGLALSRLFEKELNVSFAETDLNYLQRELPKLFEKLEISKNTSLETVGATVIVTVSNHIFRALCEETSTLKRTHETVGCPLSSALACGLAKATGKPVVIEKEETTPDQSKMRYIVLEG